MRDRKLSLTALTTLILTVSLPIANLPPLFQASQVLAQTPADHKVEADRLFQQGNEQFHNSQYKEALRKDSGQGVLTSVTSKADYHNYGKRPASETRA
ncbi:TPR repeat-containing protein [Nostoc commune NIES-4072]|uniref:TPR repeat-containing protein n=1 Tax=Nostoc commune NIES-4072 TaxID=2005467 RepID=A0A2R5FVR9_NOSCO|nr:hypothetical protein [Nostoc commune]BBD70196.1 TPR repeat-containing protein [Nostoc commune HK-02]GBG22850.1 TPR repeat-containing protein [Nostoc commune NIES-4072]